MTDTLWYTRCPVPTASGLAHSLGWLGENAQRNGLEFGVLQDAGPELAKFHFDHALSGLIREGGNVPALAARAAGSPTRLIGLTWIDEAQAILVGPDSRIADPAGLAGARIGIPGWAQDQARSFPRAMALHGFSSALRLAGLTLADVRVTELKVERDPQVRTEVQQRARNITWGVEELLNGEVDAIYVKGARAQEVAKEHGLRVAVDLDATDSKRLRVNNGTPRPLTVHQELLDTNPDAVIGFLAQSLRAADWAGDHAEGVREVLQRETLSGPEGVVAAYGDAFHRGLHPSLDPERVELLGVQKQFLYTYGFLAADFDLDSWVAHEPLTRARELVAAGKVAA
ncbi:ABC transporter substrate-binding protein [Nocardia yamanashiensis]|uniref:ABC transporter substrate-binding protein n=1 Tax=Nocardia yamanashiensis TaxID=209247 RepID=UPI001E5521A2|nr:ABC transporter substrate-binding protein [Nocardia yamanashiensis]UGT43658.1 ABC transporter substrate-binding protein [Nocardia yamanashiensis]